jgi:hypothetical protein
MGEYTATLLPGLLVAPRAVYWRLDGTTWNCWLPPPPASPSWAPAGESAKPPSLCSFQGKKTPDLVTSCSLSQLLVPIIPPPGGSSPPGGQGSPPARGAQGRERPRQPFPSVRRAHRLASSPRIPGRFIIGSPNRGGNMQGLTLAAQSSYPLQVQWLTVPSPFK